MALLRAKRLHRWKFVLLEATLVPYVQLLGALVAPELPWQSVFNIAILPVLLGQRHHQ